MSSLNRLFFLCALIFLNTIAIAQPVDVTNVVQNRTQLPKILADNCGRIAGGNEKSCRLKSATVETTSGLFRVVVSLEIRSRHVPTRGIVLYDNRSEIKISADVTPECLVKNLKMESNNDIYDLVLSIFESEAKDKISKAIAHC
ncbi:hypothetical protein [Prosthecodimorpha hirschii]|uniref:hypothetical protein n=1 Tax=Prosthecodimorpha hirschii TaxID=665126 RepID=UPI001126D500|nr:hypothetical protein [Prosthecomicrobium hirschii]